MTEEDVKAMYELDADVAASLRWLSREGVHEDIRMINAAMLLTKVGLRIAALIDRGSGVPEVDPGPADAETDALCVETAETYAPQTHAGLRPLTEEERLHAGFPPLTEEERLIGTVIADISLLSSLADIVAGDFDDGLIGSLLLDLRGFVRIHSGMAEKPDFATWLMAVGGNTWDVIRHRGGRAYVQHLAGNRMEPSYFRSVVANFRRCVARMNPSRNIGAVA